MNHEELFRSVIEQGGSDLHITVGVPPTIRKNGKLAKIGQDNLTPADTEKFIKQLVNEEQMKELEKNRQVDFSFSLPGVGRFRVNAFKQRGVYSAAIRHVNSSVSTIKELGLPDIVSELARKTKGLILVTGPTGSGKSTILASMIDQINEERDCHILTLEDPIEYLHKHKRSIVNQREIGNDAVSYANALKAALREDPDVIMVGELRDVDTISIALTAAETGHLVLSTLHTTGAVSTIDRIIDIFEPHRQQQVRVQLSMVLQGIISQQLIRRRDEPGRIAAIEVMVATPSIRNLIREGKTHRIDSYIKSGAEFGMQSMDSSLVKLYREGRISYEDVFAYAFSQENIKTMLEC